MIWTQCNAATGYELWHKRLWHVPFRNIEQTIKHSIGLVQKKYPKDDKCCSCMIGKSKFESYAGPKEPDLRLMALVHMDVYSLSVTSMRVITMLWSLPTVAPNIVGRMIWYIMKDHPILVAVQDKGQDTSKELNNYFTEHGVKNYFSTPYYKQWQNGLA